MTDEGNGDLVPLPDCVGAPALSAGTLLVFAS